MEHLLGEEAFEKQLDVMDGRQEQESGSAEGEKKPEEEEGFGEEALRALPR